MPHTSLQEEAPFATESKGRRTAGLLSTAKIHEDFVFCDEAHPSSDCLSAEKMELSEKQKILRKSCCCFSCLSPGHVAKKRKTKSWCVFCGRGDVILICEELKWKCSTNQTSDDDHDYAITSMMKNARVFLQTLKVKPECDTQELPVLAFIYTGRTF
jgi:hypothetical protein